MDRSLLKTIFKAAAVIFVGALILFFVSRCEDSSAVVPSNNSTYTDVVFLSTTDMHGKCWDSNLLTDSAEPHNMLRVSTAVDTIRNEYGRENVIVIDNGDIFEGESISVLQLHKYESGSSDLTPAMAICLDEIGYDAFVIGNHEFDFNLETMKRIYAYLEEKGVSVLSANTVYDGSDGVHEKGENAFTPYITKAIKVNGNDHKIGILGLENVDVPRWESKDKYPGLQFVHPGNETYSMAEEAREYITKMKEEGCEFITVCYHGGLGGNEEELIYGENTNHQGLRLIAETEDIDLLIVGHDHNNQYSNNYYRNSKGEEVLLVNGGGQDLTESIFRFKEGNDGKLEWEILSSENLKLENFAVDEQLQEKIRPYAEECEIAVNEPIGKLEGDWDGSQNFYTEQTDTMDLVNKVMIWTGNKLLSEQTSGNEQEFYERYNVDHRDVDLAVTTVSVRNSYTAEAGDISWKGVYRIYRYNNLLNILPMKGSEIRAMMEENASSRLKGRVLNGKPYIFSFDDIYTNVIFGGINFTYDLSKEAGQRVNIIGLSNGRKFSGDEVYLVATTDYLTGNEKCGLRNFADEDSVLDKETRIVDGLADYIRETSAQKGGVTTDDFDWHWEASYPLTSENEKPYEGTVYASLVDKPEDGKTYVLYNESDGRAIINDEGKLGTAQVDAIDDYLVTPLPENTIMFTVEYVKDDLITLRNEEGKYLTCDTLNWINSPEEGVTAWKLNTFSGGWQLISTEETGTGTQKAMQLYKTLISTYELGPYTGFCFNFYEPNE